MKDLIDKNEIDKLIKLISKDYAYLREIIKNQDIKNLFRNIDPEKIKSPFIRKIILPKACNLLNLTE